MNKIIKKVLFATPVITAIGAVGVYFGLSTSKDIKLNNVEDIPTDAAVLIPQIDEPDKPSEREGSPVKAPISTASTNEFGLKIFPTLNQATYYKYIRIANGEAYISDELISHVVNDVLMKMQYTDGKVYWSYEFTNPLKKQDVLISFRLRPSGDGFLKSEVKRTYHFTIGKSIV